MLDVKGEPNKAAPLWSLWNAPDVVPFTVVLRLLKSISGAVPSILEPCAALLLFAAWKYLMLICSGAEVEYTYTLSI